MSFDFDQVVDRVASDSVKWSLGPDVIASWVGDMDFACPPAVLDAMRQRLAHPVLGYPTIPEALFEVTAERIRNRTGWAVEPSWLIRVPGVVPAIYAGCREFAAEGEVVMTQMPNYHHLLEAPLLNRRRLGEAPVRHRDGAWRLDAEAMRANATGDTRLFLLCNPHNPVGRMLDEEELRAIATLVVERDWVLISDEIHSELLLDETRRHIPIASLDEDVAQRTITLFSPNKTFNLAGLPGAAVAIVPNEVLRARLEDHLRGIMPHTGVLAYAATLAAYRDCDDWLDALLVYLRRNHARVFDAVGATPGISMTAVEATYFAWLDVTELGLSDPHAWFLEHGLALSAGEAMAAPNFVRLNFATPRALLDEALSRLRQAAAAAPG